MVWLVARRGEEGEELFYISALGRQSGEGNEGEFSDSRDNRRQAISSNSRQSRGKEGTFLMGGEGGCVLPYALGKTVSVKTESEELLSLSLRRIKAEGDSYLLSWRGISLLNSG